MRMIRPMNRRDVPECLKVELDCFETPWGEEEMLKRLANQYTLGLVAIHDAKVRGFAMFELHKDGLYVTTVAVAANYRRKKLGSDLLAAIKKKMQELNRTLVRLDIRERNLPGQLFFKKNGFLAKRVMPDWYGDTGEASYRMEYQANGSEGAKV